MRPALRYFGGKWRIAPWILSHLPEHRIYVESFGGDASVLIRKKRSYAEVYNDIDGEIVNYFRVLRDPEKAEQLERLVKLTPFAREEFLQSYERTDCDVEMARFTLIKSFMGFSSNSLSKKSGFRANSNRSGTTPAQDWKNYPPNIELLSERMQGVVIENRNAVEVMLQHDSEETLHYVDPPYVEESRSSGSYRFDLESSEHLAIAETCNALKGMVLVSGYASDLYNDLFHGWKCVTKSALADGARKRVECLWLNDAAVNAGPQQDMFSEVAA